MTIDQDEESETARCAAALDGPDRELMLRAYRALAEFGGAPAVALLQARQHDLRPSGLNDERGCALTHGDLSAQALRRLLHRRPELAPEAAAQAPAGSPPRAARPPLSRGPHSEPALRVPRASRPPWSSRALAYACLGLGVLSPVWAVMTVFSQLTPQGLGVSGAALRGLSLVALLPAFAGLAVALAALVRRRPRRWHEWVALGLGLALCVRTLAWVAPDVLR